MSAIVIMIVGIVLGRFTGGLIMASAGAVQGAPTLARVGAAASSCSPSSWRCRNSASRRRSSRRRSRSCLARWPSALALAFGLGNRELAGEITREWYEQYRAERDAIERDVAERELEEDQQLEADQNNWR